jgi:hypothetical protein
MEGLSVHLVKVDIPKSVLSSMPQDERVFFVLSCSFLNDMAMLEKLARFSAYKKTTCRTERGAQNLQTFFLMKLLIGFLFEGWELVRTKFFATKLCLEYEPLLSESSKKDLENLKRHFDGGNNWMCSVRNDFAFHYPSSKRVIELVDEASDSDVFEIYLANYYANCLFSMASAVINCGILRSSGETSLEGAVDKCLNETKEVAKWFGNFFGGCLEIIGGKYDFKSVEVEIPEPPDIDKVTTPYFVRIDKD